MSGYEFAALVRDAVMYGGLVLVPIIVLSLVVGCFVTVPTFDRLTNKHQGTLDLILPVGGRWVRFMKYSVAIVFPNYVVRNDRAVLIFSSFPFRQHATSTQRWLSGLFLYLTIALFFAWLIGYAIDMYVLRPEDRLE